MTQTCNARFGCELIVVTPASSEVSTNFVCFRCPKEVAGRKFRVNLICLSMEGLDVILGWTGCPKTTLLLIVDGA